MARRRRKMHGFGAMTEAEWEQRRRDIRRARSQAPAYLTQQYNPVPLDEGATARVEAHRYYMEADNSLAAGMQSGNCGSLFENWMKYKFLRGRGDYHLGFSSGSRDLDFIRKQLDSRASKVGVAMSSACRLSKVPESGETKGDYLAQLRAKSQKSMKPITEREVAQSKPQFKFSK